MPPPAAFDPGSTIDDTSDLQNIVERIVTGLFASLRKCHSLEEELHDSHRDLIAFVRGLLYERYIPNVQVIASEIYRKFRPGLLRIVASDHKLQRRRAEFDVARRKRSETRMRRKVLFVEAGNRLVAARFEAIQRCATTAEPGIEHSTRSLLDTQIGITEFACPGGSEVHIGYHQEVIDLMQIPWDEKQKRRFSGCPISLRFGFLLTCISGQTLDLARNFLPLPSIQPFIRILEHDLTMWSGI
jgi:hypothetical protein